MSFHFDANACALLCFKVGITDSEATFFPGRFVFQFKGNTVAEFHAAWALLVRFDRAVVFDSEIEGDFNVLNRSVLKFRVGHLQPVAVSIDYACGRQPTSIL